MQQKYYLVVHVYHFYITQVDWLSMCLFWRLTTATVRLRALGRDNTEATNSSICPNTCLQHI